MQFKCNCDVFMQFKCNISYLPPGVVPPGVILGVIPPGVAPAPCAPGVSSHLDLLLLAPGVGVSSMRSAPRSVLGVSAQPAWWPPGVV